MLADIRGQTFAALRGPNFRLYINGQAVSLIGTWMQTVAQSWLVLQLTGSATAIGIVLALQTVPMLLLGPYGGVVADRSDKRRLMIGLQTLMGVQALILGLLVVTDTIALWHVYVLAVALGLNQCFENPARQSFMLELVGPEDLRNAVSLQSVLASCSRMIGPAVAGLVIAAGGLGVCFLLNAASFVAVVTSLLRLDVSRLQRSPAAARAKGQLREGFAYVRSTPDLAVPLSMMALVGCLGLRVPGGSAGLGRPHLRCRCRGLRLPHRRDGRRIGGGGPRRRHLGSHRNPAADPHLPRVRHRHGGRRRGPEPDHAHRAHGDRGRTERDVHVHHQQFAATRLRADDARTGDGPVVGRLPRLHGHRRSHRRMGLRAVGWPGRIAARCHRVSRRRGDGSRRTAPPDRDPRGTRGRDRLGFVTNDTHTP